MEAIELCVINIQFHITTVKDSTWKTSSKRDKMQDSSPSVFVIQSFTSFCCPLH